MVPGVGAHAVSNAGNSVRLTSAISIACWPRTIIADCLHEVSEVPVGPNSANGRPSGEGIAGEVELEGGAFQVGKVVCAVVKNHIQG